MNILFGEFGKEMVAFDALKDYFRRVWFEREVISLGLPSSGVGVATSQARGYFPEISPVYLFDQQRLYAMSGYLWTEKNFPLDPEAARQVLIQAGSRLIEHDLLELPDNWGGVFTLVAFDFLTGNCWIAGDPSGLLPLYYTIFQNNLVFCSHSRALAKIIQTSLDPLGLVQNTTFHYIIGSRTLYANIKRLNAGETLKFERDSQHILLKQTSGIYSGIEHYKSSHEMLEALWSDYISGIRQICRPPGMHGLMLSGGLDTRLVTLGFTLCDKQIAGFTIGDQDNYEVGIANRVAKLARTETTVHVPIEDSNPPLERIQRLIDRAEWANFAYCETGASVLHQQGVVSISTGIGGDIFLGGQAFSFLGDKWDKTARFKLALRRSLGLSVKFRTPVNSSSLDAAKLDIQNYLLTSLKRYRKYFHPEWQANVDQAMASLPDDIDTEVTRLLKNDPETIQQLLERFWWEHHLCKEFGRQELTLATILPLALPILHHTFFRRCSNLDPAQKADHGIYFQLVRRYFGEFASIPTANIPISLKNPDLFLWIARAARARRDQKSVKQQMLSKGKALTQRYGWANYEAWIRQTDFLNQVEERVSDVIFNRSEIHSKAQRIAAWEEKVYSGQEFLTLITTSQMASDFNV